MPYLTSIFFQCPFIRASSSGAPAQHTQLLHVQRGTRLNKRDAIASSTFLELARATRSVVSTAEIPPPVRRPFIVDRLAGHQTIMTSEKRQ